MKEEEVKQYLRNQLDSCIKRQDENYNYIFDLCYNKNYIRALKLSKINGQPVNKENFKGGEKLFTFNTKIKDFGVIQKLGIIYIKIIQLINQKGKI